MKEKRILLLRPAYGRMVNTPKAMAKLWYSGKDFYSPKFGWYCSVRDILNIEQEYSDVYFITINLDPCKQELIALSALEEFKNANQET